MVTITVLLAADAAKAVLDLVALPLIDSSSSSSKKHRRAPGQRGSRWIGIPKRPRRPRSAPRNRRRRSWKRRAPESR